MPIETQVNAVHVSLSKGIDVDKIEKELASMWSDASGAGGTTGSGVTRACTLNLIVYTTPADNRAQLDEMLDLIGEQHPGRILILIADREANEPKLEAYVSTRCRLLGATGKQVCAEQVTIETAGPLVETAATAVEPLLVPDVPVFLWWKDIPHYENELFDRMAQLADRIVIDSAAFDHPHEDLLHLARMIRNNRRAVRVSDLNWGRLTSWRTLLASFWDVTDYRPLLDAVDRFEVSYDPPNAAPNEVAPKALLLSGWLSARLGWKVVGTAVRENGVINCDLRSGERGIVLSLRRDETGELKDGMVSSVTLSAKKGEADFYVALRAGGTKLETEARVGTEHSVGRVLGYEMRSEAARLSRELAFLTRDSVYEEAVAQAAQLVDAIRVHVSNPSMSDGSN
ncbi:MAG: glucose-6-phosphate dehydrogenase assembly protein OpcA [Pyrinomonadaceae bacterium]